MPLTCECPYEYDAAEWYFYPPDDFTRLDTRRRKRCSSCGKLIDIGAECLKFDRRREPKSDVEESIYGDGDTVPLAPLWMCETCGEQFLNLEALGYCIDPTENMMELLKEYQEMTGFETAGAGR
jgi:hypothetical protein